MQFAAAAAAPPPPHPLACELLTHDRALRMPAGIEGGGGAGEDDSDDHRDFGILALTPHTTAQWTPATGLFIHMSIDTSASMLNRCTDNTSQMDHIKLMLRNFVGILKQTSDAGRTVLLQLQSFSDRLVVDLPIVNLRGVPEEHLHAVIQQLQPNGATDLGLALESNAALFEHMHKDTENTYHFMHIVMTDGYITRGIQDAERLRQLTPAQCPTVFIGCGMNHDAALMYTLGCGGGNVQHRYRSIATFDQSGMVCGDILNTVMNVAVAEVHVQCGDGDDGGGRVEVYNHLTGTWGTELYANTIVADMPRQFHVRGAALAQQARLVVRGRAIETGQEFTVEVRCADAAADLRLYLWRQRVLEILRDATQHLIAQPRLDDAPPRQPQHGSALLAPPTDDDDDDDDAAELAELESRMTNHFGVLRAFVTDNDLFQSDIYKALCDDLYIAHRSISDRNVERARIYTVARALTQGDQSAFSLNYGADAATLFSDDDTADDDTDDDDDDAVGGGGAGGGNVYANYAPTPPSAFATPFASQQATDTMRQVSSGLPPR